VTIIASSLIQKPGEITMKINPRSLWRLVVIPTLVAVAGAAGFVLGEIFTVHTFLGIGWGQAAFILWHCNEDRFRM
jgi:hypothetical protein